MSLSFNGTTGVVTGPTFTIPRQVTVTAWISPNTMGEGNGGVIWRHSPNGGVRYQLFFNGTAASNKLEWLANFSTTAGIWEMTSGFSPLSGWKGLALTYDSSSTANNPTLYTLIGSTLSTLTVGSGLTKVQTPAGSLTLDSQPSFVGNNETGFNTWDGLIGQVAVWTSLLSSDQIASILFRGPLSVPGAFLYWPMWGSDASARDYSGNGQNGTVTGAVLATLPPVVAIGL